MAYASLACSLKTVNPPLLQPPSAPKQTIAAAQVTLLFFHYKQGVLLQFKLDAHFAGSNSPADTELPLPVWNSIQTQHETVPFSSIVFKALNSTLDFYLYPLPFPFH